MADFTALKTAIQNAIKQNGNEEITGAILQEVMLAVVNTLGDSAINDLIAALSTEVTNRQNADGTLQSNINAEQSARQLGDSTLQSGINNERDLRVAADNAMQNAITAIGNHLNEGCIYVGIATTETNPSTPVGKIFYIAVAAGTYTNFLDSGSAALVLTQGINILKYNGTSWSVEQVWGVDDDTTVGSNNLIKSGGVYNKILENSDHGESFLRNIQREGYGNESFGVVIDNVGAVLVFKNKGNADITLSIRRATINSGFQAERIKIQPNKSVYYRYTEISIGILLQWTNGANLDISFVRTTKIVLEDINENIENINSEIEYVDNEIFSKNRFNKNDLYDNGAKCYIRPNDYAIVSTGYDVQTSVPIYVFDLEKITVDTLSSTVLHNTHGYRFLADDGTTVLQGGAFADGTKQTINVPDNAFYFQFSFFSECIDTLILEGGDGSGTYSEFYSLQTIADKVLNKTIHIYAADGIMSFFDKMKEAYLSGDCEVIIHEGTYTYTEELTQECKDLGWRGVPIGNNNKYYFIPGSKIICDLTNIPSASYYLFSPLDTLSIPNSFEIENVDIYAKGTIYGLHDESGSALTSTPYKHYYKNCRIVTENTQNGIAIGMGIRQNGDIRLNDCHIESLTTPTYNADVIMHGNNRGDGGTSISVVNCWFGYGFMIGGSESTNVEKRVTYCGNSGKYALQRAGDGGLNASWIVNSYCNEVRQ